MRRPSCDFKHCKRLEVLSLSWIGFNKVPEPLDLNTKLKVSQLCYLNLSHCILSDRLFKKIASKCQILSVLILQDSKDISQNAFKTLCFKRHRYLMIKRLFKKTTNCSYKLNYFCYIQHVSNFKL